MMYPEVMLENKKLFTIINCLSNIIFLYIFCFTGKLCQNVFYTLNLAMKSFIGKHHWKIINTLCCAAFIWQFYGVLHDWIVPTQKTTDMTKKNLNDFDFPIIFKICVQPGFNITALKDEGYSGINEYFLGKSRFNNSLYGWAGHNNASGTRGTVEGNLSDKR